MRQETVETAPELKALAAAYGECLWDWACIEARLFHVFTAASGLVRSLSPADTERQQTLARTFFAINGMRIRVAITHALAQQRWKKSPHLATWKIIYKELEKQRRVRGIIGHRAGFMYPDPDSSKPTIALLIDPRLYVDMAVNVHEAKNHGISLVELMKIQQDFLRLQRRMAEFVLTLVLEQHAACPQPQVGPPLQPLADKDDPTPKGSP